MACDVPREFCCEVIACARCCNDLGKCQCDAPLLYSSIGDCEELNGLLHEFRVEPNWNCHEEGDEDQMLCGACRQFVSLDDQVRCDADKCLSEFGASNEFERVCFFHEACLETVSAYMLCSLCVAANNIPLGDLNEEGEEEELLEVEIDYSSV